MNRVAPAPTDRLFAVGAFVADPVLGRLRLRSDGTDVSLTRKAFSVFLELIQAKGEVVGKDDLLRRVWPDVIVEENTLARTVSMLRKALQAHDAARKYIATTAGLGYYLQEPVEVVERAAVPRLAAGSETRLIAAGPFVATLAGGWPTARSLGVALLLALLFSSFWFAGRSADTFETVTATPQAKLWRLTTGARVELDPAWSPDGQFLAYSSERTGNFDLWIQPMKGGNPLQVTSAPEREWQPAWSPDGARLAFRSEHDGGGLYSIPAFGGSQRQLATFGQEPQWSPDGAWILFYGARSQFGTGAYIVGAGGNEQPRRVLAAALESFGQFRMAWHPDGRVSIYGPLHSGGWSFRTVSLDGQHTTASEIAAAVADRLANANVRLNSFVWSPQGDALYFEGRAEQAQNIWRIGVDPRTLRWISGPDRLTTGTNRDVGLALSPDGARIAFSSQAEQTRVWAFPFDAVEGRMTGDGEPVTPEGIDVRAATISSDGRRMAYGTNRGGHQELWVRLLDSRRDQLVGVETQGRSLQPLLSGDGATLAYGRDSGTAPPERALVLVSVDTGQQRIVQSDGFSFTWDLSADGTSALVGCSGADAGGRPFHVCLLTVPASPTETATLRPIASDPDKSVFQARFSPDHKWITFMASRDRITSAVYVMPIDGGPWIPITDEQAYHDKPDWAPDGRTLYFLTDRGGFLNLWGRRFDPLTGWPVGAPFEVTRFANTFRMIYPETAGMQIGVSRNRLILPLRETSGTIWILDNFR